MTNSMGPFARAHASRLRKKLVKQIRHAAKHTDERAIHDLRVAIRRFSQCLEEFHQFFPAGRTKKIRKRLKKLMHLAARTRDRDVALELIGATSPDLAADLKLEREQACRTLSRSLARRRNRELA